MNGGRCLGEGMKIQFVWWKRFPVIQFWHYPRDWRKPFFYGFYLGIVEIRIFPKRIASKF